jgi:hypothetical protein
MAIDKYSRTKYIMKNIVNGVNECDLPNNGFNEFEFKRPKQYYTVTQTDLQRPEIISYKFYGKMNYWWIILKLNDIEDIWHDLTIGKVLTMPNVNDIEDYNSKVKKKK